MARYTDQERREQVAAVRAYLDADKSHSWIAEKLNISKSTVQDRKREAALNDDRIDLEQAVVVRREAGDAARRWLTRIEDAYAEQAVPLLDAFRHSLRGWEFLAKLYGAFAPVRVDLHAQMTGPARIDPAHAWAVAMESANNIEHQLEDLDPDPSDPRYARLLLRRALFRNQARQHWAQMPEPERDAYLVVNDVPDWLSDPMESQPAPDGGTETPEEPVDESLDARKHRMYGA